MLRCLQYRSLEDFDEALYQSCVHACALESDFASWPEGDNTIIGAKGKIGLCVIFLDERRISVWVLSTWLLCILVLAYARMLNMIGTTISGGQKARISLARAMYSSCDVVLLDDPLSALDTVVGNWAFQRAVCEMAKRSAVVMSTHQRQASSIVVHTY